MEYKVVKESSINSLEKEVNKLISQGWKPQGGFSKMSEVNHNKYRSYHYYQAMIKE